MSHARWLLILMLLAGLGVAAIDAQAPAPRGRRILLDEAHHNLFATASGGYRPFVQLVES